MCTINSVINSKIKMNKGILILVRYFFVCHKKGMLIIFFFLFSVYSDVRHYFMKKTQYQFFWEGSWFIVIIYSSLHHFIVIINIYSVSKYIEINKGSNVMLEWVYYRKLLSDYHELRKEKKILLKWEKHIWTKHAHKKKQKVCIS